MTKATFFIITTHMIFWVCPAVAEDNILGRVEISFDYNRADRDYANNQFAVWIEDHDGNLIETLFVTQFTATKGWLARKETLPTWKKKANISHMKRDAIDAISGATPAAQRLVYTWEVDSKSSSSLHSAIYNYFVECNYYWGDTVLYKGKISVGISDDSSKAVASYSTVNAKNYSIIENVTAHFIASP